MTREFTIETLEDLDAVWPEVEMLIKGIIDYHLPWDARPLHPEWSQRVRDYMRSQTTLLARSSDGKAIGIISGTVTHETSIFEETIGHVDNAFVDESYRASGLGSELLSRFEAWCFDQGATEMRLDVTAGNELGMSFWTRRGFEPMAIQMKKPLAGSPK